MVQPSATRIELLHEEVGGRAAHTGSLPQLIAVTADIEQLSEYRKAHYVPATVTDWLLDTLEHKQSQAAALRAQQHTLAAEIRSAYCHCSPTQCATGD